MRVLALASFVLFAGAAFADDAPAAPAASPGPFDTSSAVALLGKNIIVTMHDGGISAGTLAEAGPHKLVLVLLSGAQVTIDAAQIESIRLGPQPGAAATTTASPPPTPPKPAGPPNEVTERLLNRLVIVSTPEHVTRGQLVSAGDEGIVVKTAHGNESIDRAAITSITEYRDDLDDSAPTPEPYAREKRAEKREQIGDLERQADAHNAAALQWYLGAGSGALTAVALFGGWLCLFASPFCLIGAGVGVVTAAVCGIVGLTETGAAEKAKNDAHAMAY